MFNWLFKKPEKVEYEFYFGGNDLVIIESEKTLKREQAEKIRETLDGAFDNPGLKSIVLDSGLKLKVIHR